MTVPPRPISDFFRGFREGYWWAVKTFYPGIGLSLLVFLIARAA